MHNAGVATAGFRARRHDLPLQGVVEAVDDFDTSNKELQLGFSMLPSGEKDIWKKGFHEGVTKAAEVYAFLWHDEVRMKYASVDETSKSFGGYLKW